MTKTLIPTTNQEAFDMIAAHLNAISHRSYDSETNTCMYRSDDGSKCAIGCCIRVEDYDEDFEGAGVNSLDDYGFDYGKLDVSLLTELQKAHDGEENWDNTGFIGQGTLKRIARDFDLKGQI